jgi:hypothetical protein
MPLFLALLVLTAGSALAQSTGEYQLKAIFLFKFAQFVQWPPPAFSDAKSPLIIGVLGDDPFGSQLDEAVAGESADGRRLAIQRYQSVDEIKTCHILFVCSSEDERLDQILEQLKGRDVLTVGETDAFARRGGMIQFRFENSKLRLTVNLPATSAANLTISSKLLRSVDMIAPGAAKK